MGLAQARPNYKVYVSVCLLVSNETNTLVINRHCFYTGLTTVSSCIKLIAILAQDMMGEAKIEPNQILDAP